MTSNVYIAKNVYGGDGLGRLGDGRVVFVPGAFAGESVKAEIVDERRSFVRARLVEVVEPSPDRIVPQFAPVPGMVYASLEYGAELAAKEAQLAEALDRARLKCESFGRVDCPRRPLNYRNKVVYHFEKQGGGWAIGYRREPSHDIVDVLEDPLARPEINAKLPEVRSHVLRLLTQGAASVRRDVERSGSVTMRWSARSGVQWWVGKPPAGLFVKEETCAKVFEVPSDGFYQVNPEAGERLAAAVADEYSKGAGQAPDILDLYCGVGVLGLCCVRPGVSLTGVESGRQAVESARRNAAALGVDARFVSELVSRGLGRISAGPRTTVIVDPPRGGLEPRVPQWLLRSLAPRIIYVSCDPATLVRDLRTLCRGYDIESVRWIDMFPRTARFETLVTLRRKDGNETA